MSEYVHVQCPVVKPRFADRCAFITSSRTRKPTDVPRCPGIYILHILVVIIIVVVSRVRREK